MVKLALARLDPLEDVVAHMDRQVRGDRCGQLAQEHLAGGGRRLRARLALDAAAALGADPDAAVGWAAAVELLHNASLVHDDVQDGDVERRGRPTVVARHGAAQAINVGDLLLMAPFAAIAGLPVDPALRVRLVAALAGHAMAIVRGQCADLAASFDDPPGVEAMIEVATAKTAGLFVLPVEGAALLTGQGADAAAALAATFAPIGTIYQLVDDVVDLYGDKGRPRGGDVRTGKVTALAAAHLAQRPEDLARLRAAVGATDVSDVADAFVASGALAATLARIEALADRVRRSHRLVFQPRLREIAVGLVDAAVGAVPGR